MSTSTPPKASPSVPPPPSTAFGITIAAAHGKAAEKAPMSAARKRMFMLGGALVLMGGISWMMNHRGTDLDSEAEKNEGVRQVIAAENSKDAAALTQLTKSDDSIVARRAVSALASVGGVEAIRDSLNDQRADVRLVAVTSLGSTGDISQLPTLDEFMQDPASDVRIAAVRGVSNIRDFSIFDHLMPMLNDPELSVRKSALQAIEDRVGLKFPEYKPDGSNAERAAGINRMRSMIPKMKQVFDQHNEFELNRQKANSK